MKIWMCLSIMAVLISSAATAEDSQLAPIPKKLVLGFKHYNYAGAAIEAGPATLNMAYSQLKIPLGKYDFSDMFFVPTISLEQTQIDIGSDNNAYADPTLYTAKAQFMFIRKLDDAWMRIIQIAPSMHTDGKAMDEEAYSLMGLIIWNYTPDQNSAWTFGFGANRLFGEYKPIPIIAYQYQTDKHTRVDIGFPVTKIEHSWSNQWTGFASIKPIGGNWRFETQTRARVNVAYTSWVAGVGMRYQIKPKWWATLEVGKSLARSFDLDDSDNTGELDVGSSTAIMFSIGLHP